ncbi:hypothetical protein AAG570_002152 [Ranatra chinensis]|uniref:Uncharacterized protein n=1 Tax=Ranatra chinensis TaxID=642074 RepID=A0ABD0Y8R2_9HEMI
MLSILDFLAEPHGSILYVQAQDVNETYKRKSHEAQPEILRWSVLGHALYNTPRSGHPEAANLQILADGTPILRAAGLPPGSWTYLEERARRPAVNCNYAQPWPVPYPDECAETISQAGGGTKGRRNVNCGGRATMPPLHKPQFVLAKGEGAGATWRRVRGPFLPCKTPRYIVEFESLLPKLWEPGSLSQSPPYPAHTSQTLSGAHSAALISAPTSEKKDTVTDTSASYLLQFIRGASPPHHYTRSPHQQAPTRQGVRRTATSAAYDEEDITRRPDEIVPILPSLTSSIWNRTHYLSTALILLPSTHDERFGCRFHCIWIATSSRPPSTDEIVSMADQEDRIVVEELRLGTMLTQS